MFHAKEGLFFERLEDGEVRVRVDLGSHSPIPDVIIDLDSDTWCSVIASVSFRGDVAEAFQEAKRFHSLEKQEIKPGDVGKVEDIL